MKKHIHIRHLIDRLPTLGDGALVNNIKAALGAYESYLLKRAFVGTKNLTELNKRRQANLLTESAAIANREYVKKHRAEKAEQEEGVARISFDSTKD